MTQFKRFFALFPIVLLAFIVGCTATSKHEGTGDYFDDTLLTTKVKSAVFKDPTLKSTEINVETFKGEVQLSGFVSSQAEIDRAEDIARRVQGVKSVERSRYRGEKLPIVLIE